MLFVKRKNCGQNLEYRQRPQVEGGNQDRQMIVKTEVLQFKERSFETFFYKYLSQSDTCQIESQKMKGACTKLKENNNGTVLANKLKFNVCYDNLFFNEWQSFNDLMDIIDFHRLSMYERYLCSVSKWQGKQL